jgi:hypothetical protein
MARELMAWLGYAKWQHFHEAIQGVVLACAKSDMSQPTIMPASVQWSR